METKNSNNVTCGNYKSARQMFSSIVPYYDRANHILSIGLDSLWRKNAIHQMGDISSKKCLDLCCGTGKLTKLLSKKGAEVFSLDFSIDMIASGIEKGSLGNPAVTAEAASLPYKTSSFDTVTIAFGIRNIFQIDSCIQETFRVLKNNGTFMILELTMPGPGLIGGIIKLYIKRILPLLGWLVSGRWNAYRYLSRSIQNFISTPDLLKKLESNGFIDCRYKQLAFGASTIFICRKQKKT